VTRTLAPFGDAGRPTFLHWTRGARRHQLHGLNLGEGAFELVEPIHNQAALAFADLGYVHNFWTCARRGRHHGSRTSMAG
jgi:hypothetical protein